MDTRQDDLRRDLDATLQARKELGPEYESELVDSFLARIDARLDARVERRVAERLGPAEGYGPTEGYGRPGYGPRRFGRRSATRLPIVSLVLGIPLSAIAAESGGFWGLLVCWGGIVGVNVSSALAERIQEQRGAAAPKSDWDR
ncbi:hypothetical protein [Kitasatospora purpeofusca]|uniref:hypothetical protein n=1 Tax=Kitasatospora purpeofusca TaxID=67352 RepID=UPI0022546212|nr:hypothetical protein [Kitasatospora purpeofusca]MCX4753151.1 hypothetical protein [Kitasatospora purpeofusca]WSR32675.1 hypothetical protein OG715_17805 [Kitasatospora purpeofusca]